MERFEGLILEFRRKAVVNKSLSADYRRAFSLAGDGITAQLRAAALHEVCYLDMKFIGALVNECKCEVLLTGLEFRVILHGITCSSCHFLD